MSRALLIVCLALGAWIETAQAAVSVSGRHLMILREGIDAVWGSYIFAVQSDEAGPVKLSARLRLPKETIDFMPQEGVEPSEVKLDGDALAITKEFPPGTTIVTIGFKVSASFGQGELTLRPAEMIDDLTVLLPKRSQARIASEWLAPAGDEKAPDPDYVAFVGKTALAADSEKRVTITGVPEGRKRIWILGSAVAVLLFLLAALAAVRTRPSLTEADGETVLVG